MSINFAAASTAGLNNPGTEIITLVKDGSGNFINPPSYDKMRAYLSSGEVPMLFVTDEGGETGSLYQLADYSETENKIRFSNDITTIAFSAGAPAPVEAVSVQPDWNQNDSTAADYVKNRPFYTGTPVETALVEDINVPFSNPSASLYYGSIPTTIELIAGDAYKVSWDGATYECVCELIRGNPAIGNPSIIGAGADTSEPFLILPLADNQGTEVYTLDTSNSHTISISGFVAAEVVKIPDKYISDTFRDVVIAGDPLVWTADEWAMNYSLFLSGKLLQITTDSDSIKKGYVLSMYYGATSHISFIDSTGNLYSLCYNNAAGQLYWRPLLTPTEDIYLRYLQNASSPTDETLEYATLGSDGAVLNFTTKNANENYIKRRVVLEGDPELILTSSTANSAKKFKITVNDSGTISATEVT